MCEKYFNGTAVLAKTVEISGVLVPDPDPQNDLNFSFHCAEFYCHVFQHLMTLIFLSQEVNALNGQILIIIALHAF